ncbi:MAG: hypothetical protein HKN27_16570 [Silicimonas sp.]|nr:hypothetical protein [Silicimonas sp.]
MKAWIIAVLAAFSLQACVEEGTYPLTGEECSEDDPVLDMDAADCTIPGSGI